MTVATLPTIERLRITLHGAVQGVGFRPTIYRLAGSARLGGWVRNTSEGLEIEVEGTSERLDVFLKQLEIEQPSAARISGKDILRLPPQGGASFEILPSEENASSVSSRTVAVLPDLATCSHCLSEVLDPANRRFGYAFTNCTLCGPRYTIQSDIPYDRSNTTMKNFVMCPACRREYDTYSDRRFHAQPNACNVCGPQLRLWPTPAVGADPIPCAAVALTAGKIVALKGIGGFQLLVDACNPVAVTRLRERKHRDEKPFAILMPSMKAVRRYCEVSTAEEELLLSQAAPIVLLAPKIGHNLAAQVSQASPLLGIMLPSSPLHHLLMAQYPFPVVATSGNDAGEPIAIENREAVACLKGIADVFVLHSRPIARPCDDSVTRVLDGPQVLRRARGYAPLPILTPYALRPVIAVGGHLKNTVAISMGRQVFLSQHIGDLGTLEAREVFDRTIADLCRLYRFRPEALVSDLHPDYASTAWARERSASMGLPLIQVQHHHAHVAACAAENGLEGDYLGVAWDGAGLGLDGTIWGGEFFLSGRQGFERIAHLRQFPLPGGEAAMLDCSRSAAGILWEALDIDEARDLIAPGILSMLGGDICTPKSSSIGRLFDAVAYLTRVATRNFFEGQAAMLLESAIGKNPTHESYEIELQGAIGDWAPLIRQILQDMRTGLDVRMISAKFHNALVDWIVAVARTADVHDVVLSGGVFQNAYLITRATKHLKTAGFRVHTHHQVPANDGGLALGQAVLAGQH